MSENNTNKQQKIYVPGTQVKEFTFPSGDKVLRLSLNLAKLAPFIKEHKNENGYINFNITARREIGPYGDSHNVSLDTFKPKPKTGDSTKPAEKKITSTPVSKKSAPAPAENNDEEFV